MKESTKKKIANYFSYAREILRPFLSFDPSPGSPFYTRVGKVEGNGSYTRGSKSEVVSDIKKGGLTTKVLND